MSGAFRAAVIDAAHLARQREFSERTFGPGPRTKGVLDHIRKELKEVGYAPFDLGEWVDVLILAFDGAWRAGHEPQAIIDAIKAKQARNEARTWPDWRGAAPDKAIEHVRAAPAPRTDTDAALTRIQAEARLGGIVLHVTEGWATCTCTTGTHPWMKRLGAADEARAREWVAAAVSRPDRHVIHNHRLDGYTAWEVAE